MNAFTSRFQQFLWPTRLATPAAPAAKPAAVVTPEAKPAAATGPLAPQFDISKSKFQRAIAESREASADLGATFHASKIEMAGANIDAQPRFYGYHTDKPMTLDITQKLPNDRLDAAVFLNVSGHDWRDDASLSSEQKQKLLDARAKDNTYIITVERPDGTKETMTGIKANGALSTEQDITIANMKPGVYILEAWPDHSAGVDGYVEGRRVVINYSPGGDGFR